MSKLVQMDSKQEVEKPLDMIKGGSKPVGPAVKEHNMAAMSSRDYPKKGAMDVNPGMSSMPDDVRGDTSKAL